MRSGWIGQEALMDEFAAKMVAVDENAVRLGFVVVEAVVPMTEGVRSLFEAGLLRAGIVG